MKRSSLKNKVNKSGKEKDIGSITLKKLNNELKKTYFKEKFPEANNVQDFWNYHKPYFTNEGICK